jgi:hypothetical protein
VPRALGSARDGTATRDRVARRTLPGETAQQAGETGDDLRLAAELSPARQEIRTLKGKLAAATAPAHPASDPALDLVERELRKLDLDGTKFGMILRQALDEPTDPLLGHQRRGAGRHPSKEDCEKTSLPSNQV